MIRGSVAISSNSKTLVCVNKGDNLGFYYTDNNGEEWNEVNRLLARGEIISDRVNSDNF